MSRTPPDLARRDSASPTSVESPIRVIINYRYRPRIIELSGFPLFILIGLGVDKIVEFFSGPEPGLVDYKAGVEEHAKEFLPGHDYLPPTTGVVIRLR